MMIGLKWAVAVFCIAASGFGVVVNQVVSGASLTRLDVRLAQALREVDNPVLTTLMQGVSWLHDPWPVTVYVVILAAVFARKRMWSWLPALLFAVPCGALLNTAAKNYFQRPRPDFTDLAGTVSSFSFPSGHASSSLLLYGLLAAAAVTYLRKPIYRAIALVCAIAMVLWVCASRVYLGVHYLSDVIAGVLAGAAWLSVCFTVMHLSTHYQQRSSSNNIQTGRG
jgi:undecaprenyl-diphosphatase